jgi:hypothetical protein
MLRVAGETLKSLALVPLRLWLVTFSGASPVSLTLRVVLTGVPIRALPTVMVAPGAGDEP